MMTKPSNLVAQLCLLRSCHCWTVAVLRILDIVIQQYAELVRRIVEAI